MFSSFSKAGNEILCPQFFIVYYGIRMFRKSIECWSSYLLSGSSLRISSFVSFSRGRDRTCERVKRAWGEQKIGSEERVRGEKRNHLQSIRNTAGTSVDHERGAIVQFDWLVALQSKRDIRHLTFMHSYGRVRGSVRIFCSENAESSSAKRQTY